MTNVKITSTNIGNVLNAEHATVHSMGGNFSDTGGRDTALMEQITIEARALAAAPPVLGHVELKRLADLLVQGMAEIRSERDAEKKKSRFLALMGATKDTLGVTVDLLKPLLQLAEMFNKST